MIETRRSRGPRIGSEKRAAGRWSTTRCEDQRAMLAYLRTLPPEPGAVPPSRPARPDDPPADAFYFGDAARRTP